QDFARFTCFAMQFFKGCFQDDGPAFQREMALRAGDLLRAAGLFNNDAGKRVLPRAACDVCEWIDVYANVLSGLADLLPAVAERDRDGASFLSWLNHCRKLHRSPNRSQSQNVTVTQAEFARKLRRHSRIVTPRGLADRVGKFLQPWIVCVASVAQRDALVEIQ